MSCVVSKYFHNEVGNSKYEMKSYAIDNTFHIELERWNKFEGTRKVLIELTPDDAKILKTQLEEFIANNNQ